MQKLQTVVQRSLYTLLDHKRTLRYIKEVRMEWYLKHSGESVGGQSPSTAFFLTVCTLSCAIAGRQLHQSETGRDKFYICARVRHFACSLSRVRIRPVGFETNVVTNSLS